MNQAQLYQKLLNCGFSEDITKAFLEIPRENFIPETERIFVHEDIALPIGHSQTTSQPYTIAFMLTLLELRDNQKIIEVGSGSGYVLALINTIAKNAEIYGTERIKELADLSTKRLANLKNIHIHYTPTRLGLPNKKPFNRILVSASANQLPSKLLDQLSDNGILVCPVRNSIIKAVKHGHKIIQKEFPGFVFVPLIEG